MFVNDISGLFFQFDVGQILLSLLSAIYNSFSLTQWLALLMWNVAYVQDVMKI